MAKTQILEYTIYLPDQALVDQFNAQIAASAGPGLLLVALNPSTGVVGPVGVLRAPYNAATEGGAAVEFAIEAGIYPPALPLQLPTAPFTGPCLRSPWFGSGSNFPVNVATFTRKSGGWFGISFLFGSTTKFYWVGKFAYAPPKDAVVDPGTGDTITEPAPIPQRLMLCGFDLEGSDLADADGGQDTAQINSFGSDTESSGKSASRWGTGNGYQYRPGNLSTDWAMQPLTTPALHGGWDRVYFRVRKLPTASRVIAEVENFATGGSGFKVYLTPTGAISVIGFPSSGDAQPQFTSSQTYAVDTWHRMDLLFALWGTSGPPERRFGVLEVWVDSENVGNGSIAPGGLVGNIKCSFTRVGDDVGSTDVQGEIDFDHWRTARLPKDKDVATAEWASGNGYTAGDYVQTGGIYGQRPSLTAVYKALTTHGSPSPAPASSPATWVRVGASQDWLHGSRIERVHVTGLSASNSGGWAPVVAGNDGAVLDTYPVGSALGAGPNYTSTTGLAVLGTDTDAGRLAEIPGSLGAVAVVIARYGWKLAAGAVTVFAGRVDFVDGALSDVTVSGSAGVEGQTNAPRWTSFLINLMNGTTEKLAKVIENIEIKTTKGNDANSSVTFCHHALVEIIGNFGAEDQPPAANEALPATAYFKGIHNGPYVDSPWYGSQAPPFAPVALIAGTYASDGNARYLTFPLPVHFLWIRKVAASLANPCVWWPSMLSGHVGMLRRSDGHIFGKAEKDPTFVPAAGEDQQQERYRIRIISADPRWNQNGQSYQYIAVCDPAKRACLTGAVQHEDSFPFPSSDPLEDGSFTPVAAFVWPEASGNNNNGALHYKGPAHGAGAAQSVAGGGAVSSWFDFSQGAMQFQGNAFPANCHQTPYMCWRTNDGTGELKVWAHARYTGNGTSPRNITIAPAGGGKLPLWALAVGNNQSISRDPSHTGTTSLDNGGAQVATDGIRGGGVDFITVGLLLNTNAQTYDLFVLLGGTTDSNGDGFSDNGDFFPVEPDTPTFDDEWQEPEEFDPGAGGGAGPVPGIGLDLAGDLSDSACVPFVHRVVNIALNRVGVNKPITDLTTELSAEASLVREHYDETLETTLRELPWPFATRYAGLTLVAGSVGSPVNRDWTFSYRTPDDCVFPRRLVLTSRGESADAKGPPFIESSDASGGLILCNEANAQLEYTSRIECPPAFGDATFRSAWAWLLASELAPAISRMADRAVHCIEMFRLTLQTARSFYKLGQPGQRPVAGSDPDSTSLDEKLRIINIALARIGAQTLADLTVEQSREAILAALLYEDELRSCLRDFPWAFATRYADAGAAVPTLTLVDGAIDDPAVPDWFFAFRAPTDLLFARRLVRHVDREGVGRRFDPAPPRYRVGSDATGMLIYTNEEEPVLEYTIRPANVLAIADASFRDAFAWRLSAALAPSVGRPDPEKEEQTGQAPKEPDKAPKSEGAKLQRQRLRQDQARWAWAMYLQALGHAQALNVNEQQPEDDGDASWIRERN